MNKYHTRLVSIFSTESHKQNSKKTLTSDFSKLDYFEIINSLKKGKEEKGINLLKTFNFST